jgi:hypothetical protein
MNPTLASQLHAIVEAPTPRTQRISARPLRVAASMLSRAPVNDMTATTVVGTVANDDLDAFCGLVHEIADEYGLDARITVKVGSFSVRFERCCESQTGVRLTDA